MQGRFQKIGFAAVMLVVVLSLGYRMWRAGGPEHLLEDEFSDVSPSASPVRTPLPSGFLTPQTTPTPAAATPTTAAAAALFRINERRAGTVTLQSNPILAREAQEHASDMARRGYFDHTNPDGVTFQQRMAASSYPAVAIAENLALTSRDDAAAAVGLWMESPGHRENMLNPDYNAVGIGIATGMRQGQQVTYVVAIFGAAR